MKKHESQFEKIWDGQGDKELAYKYWLEAVKFCSENLRNADQENIFNELDFKEEI